MSRATVFIRYEEDPPPSRADEERYVLSYFHGPEPRIVGWGTCNEPDLDGFGLIVDVSAERVDHSVSRLTAALLLSHICSDFTIEAA